FTCSISVLAHSSIRCIFIFFFQAEDGIRDATVTGVQTCALPISKLTQTTQSRHTGSLDKATRWLQSVPTCFGTTRERQFTCRTRSEERRVGKECRSRG